MRPVLTLSQDRSEATPISATGTRASTCKMKGGCCYCSSVWVFPPLKTNPTAPTYVITVFQIALKEVPPEKYFAAPDIPHATKHSCYGDAMSRRQIDAHEDDARRQVCAHEHGEKHRKHLWWYRKSRACRAGGRGRGVSKCQPHVRACSRMPMRMLSIVCLVDKSGTVILDRRYCYHSLWQRSAD